MRRRGRMKQGEESAAVKKIKHRNGSSAQIFLGTANGLGWESPNEVCTA